jgi:hypothetical protein
MISALEQFRICFVDFSCDFSIEFAAIRCFKTVEMAVEYVGDHNDHGRLKWQHLNRRPDITNA